MGLRRTRRPFPSAQPPLAPSMWASMGRTDRESGQENPDRQGGQAHLREAAEPLPAGRPEFRGRPERALKPLVEPTTGLRR